MHRHGYKGKKFHRETAQRSALIKVLAESLIEHGSITTTLPKAKALRPYIEKLVTKAKLQTLHARRQVISKLSTEDNANKLVNEIAPLFAKRNGGYTSIKRQTNRRGDNAQMATISFVETLKSGTPAASDNQVTKTSSKTSPAKPVTPKKSPGVNKTTSIDRQANKAKPAQQQAAPKRTGVRGNK